MPLTRVVLSLIAALSFGVYLSWSGWRGWLTKEILVRQKSGPDFVAYAAGPNAGAFQFQVWIQIIGGALLVLIGIGCVVLLLAAPPDRRREAISAADSALTWNIRSKLIWIGVLVLFAICVGAVSVAVSGT